MGFWYSQVSPGWAPFLLLSKSPSELQCGTFLGDDEFTGHHPCHHVTESLPRGSSPLLLAFSKQGSVSLLGSYHASQLPLTARFMACLMDSSHQLPQKHSSNVRNSSIALFINKDPLISSLQVLYIHGKGVNNNNNKKCLSKDNCFQPFSSWGLWRIEKVRQGRRYQAAVRSKSSNSQQHRQNSFLSSSCQFQSDTKQIASCVAGHGPWVQNPAAVGLSHFSESWCPLLLADREQESRGDIFISFLKDGLVLPFTYTCAYVCLSFVLVFVCACGCP